jgi:hypothetical protein
MSRIGTEPTFGDVRYWSPGERIANFEEFRLLAPTISGKFMMRNGQSRSCAHNSR